MTPPETTRPGSLDLRLPPTPGVALLFVEALLDLLLLPPRLLVAAFAARRRRAAILALVRKGRPDAP